jgi:hypothetical protein
MTDIHWTTWVGVIASGTEIAFAMEHIIDWLIRMYN